MRCCGPARNRFPLPADSGARVGVCAAALCVTVGLESRIGACGPFFVGINLASFMIDGSGHEVAVSCTRGKVDAKTQRVWLE